MNAKDAKLAADYYHAQEPVRAFNELLNTIQCSAEMGEYYIVKPIDYDTPYITNSLRELGYKVQSVSVKEVQKPYLLIEWRSDV